MGSLLLLVALCVVMALASFLAGALPLSMTLSQSQLRMISSIGVGILVGTSLIVIIPEGIEAVASTAASAKVTPSVVRLARRWSSQDAQIDMRSVVAADAWTNVLPSDIESVILPRTPAERSEISTREETTPVSTPAEGSEKGTDGFPTFWIGLSLISGFVLMYLIDQLPRHAVESFREAVPTTHHVSLGDLGTSSAAGEEEGDGFLESLTPPPKQSRSLATTTGLVIHAAADGIAMGASATTEDMKLGFIIFAAIMIHKAPAAFGLTSVLLKQGLSKRGARGHLIVFSLAAPVGALGTFILISILGGQNMDSERGQWWTGMLLLFSGGTFLYVAMHAMQEDGASQAHDHHSSMNGYTDGNGSQRKSTKPQMRDTLITVAGMLVPLLTQVGHHH